VEGLAAEGRVSEVVELGQTQNRQQKMRGEREMEGRGVVQSEVESVQVEICV
jgi:hypothetical protein